MAFHVSRPTMYRHLTAANQGKDCVLVVYRTTRGKKVDAHTNRRYGETGASEKVQHDADRMWSPPGAATSRRSSTSPTASWSASAPSTPTGNGRTTTAVTRPCQSAPR